MDEATAKKNAAAAAAAKKKAKIEKAKAAENKLKSAEKKKKASEKATKQKQTAAKTWKKGERKEKQIILMCKQKYTLPPHAPKEASPLAPPDAPGQRESVCRKERASKVRV